ncbi:unnamed protein product [Nezara viridula]|uniref:Uncharacterized protein n=1 Tax=Nezara viridula TaxID=85310 RepID=A0A9P0HMB2_NEZVI|nr:unnamed protein product [Nezara viridula]
MNMALKTFLFVVTNCLLIFSCYSAPQNLSGISLAKFVLDGKEDCGIVNNDQHVNKLFKIIYCPSEVKTFSSDYFYQRGFLPCFGAYDSLYNLCAFPHDTINFTTPESFKDPKKFCTEAKIVYDHRPFKYTNDDVKKWGEVFHSTMINEALCNNLCVINNAINDQCIAMVTFANEYIRLKETSVSNKKVPISVDNKLQFLKDQTATNVTSEVKIASDTLLKNNISSLKTTNASESINQGSVTDVTQLKTDAVIQKETVKVNQNLVGESKSLVQSDSKSAKLSPGDEAHINEGNVPEIETPNKEMKPSNDKDLNVPPVTNINITPKGPPTIFDEGINDENEKAFTDGDDIRGENEEAIPGETKEKGETDEESEKPIEEDKNTVSDTEQHAAFHGAISPAFTSMNDNFSESEDSYSFTYIVTTMAALCCVYLLFHYRNKLMALALEGRKGRSSRGRGRPSSANYSKLHSNLEEAIASNVTTPSATHVLY